MTNISPHIAHKIDIQFLVYFRSAWESEHLIPISVDPYTYALFGDLAVKHVDELLDYYLSIPRFTCCDISVGLDITVDRRNWAEYYSDHLWHFMGWFYALTKIIEGGPIGETAVFVFDQSFLKLIRNNNDLTLYDENVLLYYPRSLGNEFAWSPITVNLWDFAAHVVAAGEVYAALIQNLHKAIAARGYAEDDLPKLLENQSDKPVAEGDDIPLKLAIIARELNVGLEVFEQAKTLVENQRNS